MKYNFTHYYDWNSNLGWVEVPYELLASLGIAHKITSNSYETTILGTRYVLLCNAVLGHEDFTLFWDAMEDKGHEVIVFSQEIDNYTSAGLPVITTYTPFNTQPTHTGA